MCAGKNGFKLMPRVILIYSYTNVIPRMNYSTEQPRPKVVKSNHQPIEYCLQSKSLSNPINET